jgi:hypothetical protein
MHRFICLSLVLAVPPALALGQAAPAPESVPPPDAPAPQGPPPAPPPASPAPPPAAEPQASAVPSGQWVYTSQYGWLWIPHGQQYTYVQSDLQVYPDQYVYYPAYGWRWVVAPWVFGYGPAPYWGAWGPRYFAWYAHPWFRVGGYWGWGGYRGWGHYRGWIGPRAWGAHGWRGAPTYYRTGVGGPHPGHVVHGGPHPGRAVPGGPPHGRGHRR